jgi:hypothetical protein
MILSTTFYLLTFSRFFFTNYMRVTIHQGCAFKGGIESNTGPNLRQAGALTTYLRLVPQYPTAFVLKAPPYSFFIISIIVERLASESNLLSPGGHNKRGAVGGRMDPVCGGGHDWLLRQPDARHPSRLPDPNLPGFVPHCKKGLAIFPSPARMSRNKLPRAGSI